MTLCVLDCSAALSWVLPDETSPAMDQVLFGIVAEGAAAPSLWPYEVANALAVASRRGRITAAGRTTATRFLGQLPVEIDQSDKTRLWSDVLGLAIQHQLSAYDASYLELALRLGKPLATLDRKLIQSAQTCGVAILGVEPAALKT